jgi:hypothetical protein
MEILITFSVKPVSGINMWMGERLGSDPPQDE